MTAKELLDFLIREAKEKGLTPTEFRRKQNVSYAVAWRLLNGRVKHPDLEIVLRLMTALDIRIALEEKVQEPVKNVWLPISVRGTR